MSIVKNAFKKCAALDFLFLALLFISVKLLCTYIKRDCIETVIVCELVVLAAAWIFEISYRC